MIKTKIVATLGPACAARQMIGAFIDHGVDVFRLNFSHGTLDGHAEMLKMVNAVRESHAHTTAVMGDLCGPKIRTARIDPARQSVDEGDEVVIVRGSFDGTAHRFGANYDNLVDDLRVGQRVFIDDGQIALEVIDRGEDRAVCRVHTAGMIRSHKGINLPDTHVSVPSITEADWKAVDWAIENDLDFLALSFVRSAEDVASLKQYLHRARAPIKVVVKVETPQAVQDLGRIVNAADAVLVARGDLGVEMDLAEVPLIQKQITRMCRDLGKPVIVATQMLQSMIDNPVPTRAEVSDIANAIMDLTDSVMLSGETAVGAFPLQAVKTIRRTAAVTENYLDKNEDTHPVSSTTSELVLTGAIARSVAQIVDAIDPQLVAVWSQSGSTARLLSKARIDVPVVAFSSNRKVCRQMCLHYGVIPRCRDIPAQVEQFSQMVEDLALERKWARPGDRIVLVTGRPIGTAGTTNAILVHTLQAE